MSELETCLCGNSPTLHKSDLGGYYYACSCGREGGESEQIAGAMYFWNTMMDAIYTLRDIFLS